MNNKALNLMLIFKLKKVGSTKSKISQNPGKTGMNPLDMSETTNLPSLDQNLRPGQWRAFELLWFKNSLKSNFGSIFMRTL